jgi:hypothetical protein
MTGDSKSKTGDAARRPVHHAEVQYWPGGNRPGRVIEGQQLCRAAANELLGVE